MNLQATLQEDSSPVLRRSVWKEPALSRLVLYLLALLPLIAYVLFVGYFQRNLPIFDDYLVQLELARLKAAPTFAQKLSILFNQLNEHRLVYTRFWFWLVHTLNGTISYSALIVVGNLSLAGIWGLCLWFLYRLNVSRVAWVPVSWLLFQLQYYENSLWAMASLQNFTIHLLYPLLFVLITSSRRNAWLASWGVASVLCFTSGNGFLAVILAGGALLYQRRWRDAFLWALLTAALIGVYFWSYQHPPEFPVADMHNGLAKVTAILIFLGLHLDAYSQSTTFSYYVLNGLIVCVPVFLLTVWSSWQLIRNWQRRQPLCPTKTVLLITVLMTGFITLSAVVAVQNRLSFLGWSGLVESRYRLYSTMLILTGYVQLLAFARQQTWATNRIGWGVLGISILLWAGIYQHKIGSAYLIRSRALAGYHNWTQTQPPINKDTIATVFTPSVEEATILNRIKQSVLTDAKAYPIDHHSIKSLIQQDQQYVIESAKELNSQSPDDWQMVIFWDTDHYQLFPVKRTPNRNGRSFWLNQTWFGNGFQAGCVKWTLKKQTPHWVGVLQYRHDSLTVYRSSYVVQP